LHYGCIQTSVLYRRRGNVQVSKEWMKRVIQYEPPNERSDRAAVQWAALEALAAPTKAVGTLLNILDSRKVSISAESRVLAETFLARAYLVQGQRDSCKRAIQACLTEAGVHGIEEAIAAELNSDRALLDAFIASGGSNPVLDVVLGRVEALEVLRRGIQASASADQKSVRIQVDGFGPGRIFVDSKGVSGLKRQPRELFHYFVDKKGATRDAIGDMFWPAYSPGRKAANIHSAVHSIRAAIGKRALVLEDGVYSLNPDLEISYDVGRFETSANVAEKLMPGDPRRFFALTEAIGQYKGPFLSDSASQWASERRRELELRYLDLVGTLANEALMKDQPNRAVSYLRKALAVDPLRDDLNLKYLQALGRLGLLSEASLHYHQYVALVRQELGIDPPAPIRELYSRLIG
jgi:two-component SAPR family response regulator